jgi:hypothetical protein
MFLCLKMTVNSIYHHSIYLGKLMRLVEKHKPELVSEKLELPFSMDCLGMATVGQLVVAHKLVVLAEHRLVAAAVYILLAAADYSLVAAVVGKLLVVAVVDKLLVVAAADYMLVAVDKLLVAVVDHNWAVAHNWVAAHKSAAVEQRSADTTLQAIKK